MEDNGSDWQALSDFVYKKSGITIKELRGYQGIIHKDIPVIMKVTPKHYNYAVEFKVTIYSNTMIKICGNNIPDYYKENYYSFEKLGNTNHIAFQINPLKIKNDGYFYCNLKDLVEALKPQ